MSGNSKPEKRRGSQPDPTPEEIALLCEIIREERSEELRERMASRHYRPVEVTVHRMLIDGD